MTQVVHCKRKPYDVYIGRPSVFGNPWTHKGGTQADFVVSCRTEAIECYERWLRGDEKFAKVFPEKRAEILRRLPSLKGKTLGCWCKPKACHGDVLARMAEETPEDDEPVIITPDTNALIQQITATIIQTLKDQGLTDEL